MKWVQYHVCNKKPDDAMLQNVEYRDGVWKICELRGSFLPSFVPIKIIEDRRCPWGSLELPDPTESE